MHITKILTKLFLASFLLVAGCKSQKKGQTELQSANVQDKVLQLILTDNYGGSEQAELLVLRDAGDLKRFFMKVNKTRKPGIPIPEIDFENRIALIYCSGKMNGDQIPELYTMEETPDRMILAEADKDLGSSSTSSALIVPFALYTLPITEKEITLKPKK